MIGHIKKGSITTLWVRATTLDLELTTTINSEDYGWLYEQIMNSVVEKFDIDSEIFLDNFDWYVKGSKFNKILLYCPPTNG